MKFHEAELLKSENWKKSPINCTQLMIPIFLRKKLNQKLERDVFSENTKFSDFFPTKKLSSILKTKESPKSKKEQ